MPIHINAAGFVEVHIAPRGFPTEIKSSAIPIEHQEVTFAAIERVVALAYDQGRRHGERELQRRLRELLGAEQSAEGRR